MTEQQGMDKETSSRTIKAFAAVGYALLVSRLSFVAVIWAPLVARGGRELNVSYFISRVVFVGLFVALCLFVPRRSGCLLASVGSGATGFIAGVIGHFAAQSFTQQGMMLIQGHWGTLGVLKDTLMASGLMMLWATGIVAGLLWRWSRTGGRVVGGVGIACGLLAFVLW